MHPKDMVLKMKRMPFSVRLSKDEYNEIARRADLDGYCAGSYIRRAALLAAARRVPTRDYRRDELARSLVLLVSELATLGATRIGRSDPSSELMAMLRNIRASMRAHIEGKEP